MVNAIFAGQMNDPTKLAVVGLANVFIEVLILSMMVGLNTGIETLTSQGFGHGNLRLCGLYLNRGAFILTAFFLIFTIVPSIFSTEIFLALG